MIGSINAPPGSKVKVSDGPFTEVKELVGGYAIVDVPPREKALEVVMVSSNPQPRCHSPAPRS
jgi:hypothetical protein